LNPLFPHGWNPGRENVLKNHRALRALPFFSDGNIIGVVADKGLRNPSSASFHGDLMCVAEIAGRVSVWNKENQMVAELGVNNVKGQTNTPKVAPMDWREGVVTSPHGITFDAHGNILETEWNQFGRVLRWNCKRSGERPPDSF
jgi:hypothetical protein